MKTMDTLSLLAQLNDAMNTFVKPQLAQLSDIIVKHSIDMGESSASRNRTETLLQSLLDKIDNLNLH